LLVVFLVEVGIEVVIVSIGGLICVNLVFVELDGIIIKINEFGLFLLKVEFEALLVGVVVIFVE